MRKIITHASACHWDVMCRYRSTKDVASGMYSFPSLSVLFVLLSMDIVVSWDTCFKICIPKGIDL